MQDTKAWLESIWQNNRRQKDAKGFSDSVLMVVNSGLAMLNR